MINEVMIHDSHIFVSHFKTLFICLGDDKVKIVRILLAEKLKSLYEAKSELTTDNEIIELVRKL